MKGATNAPGRYATKLNKTWLLNLEFGFNKHCKGYCDTRTLKFLVYNALNVTKTLQPNGHFTQYQVQNTEILRSAHTVYLCFVRI